MRRQYLWVLVLILVLVLTAGVGCKKKPVAAPTPVAPPPPPPPAPTVPAPTVTLSANPDTIQRGQTSTLQWSSTNANTLTLEPGLGRVPEKGTMSVSPYDTMTYRITAQGPGGSAEAQARLTVTPRPEPPAPPKPVEVPIAALFDRNVRDIYFDYDKYDIRPDAVPVLQQDADFLRRYSQVNIVIEGHCDERGSEEYNIGLGERRASATKDYLVSLGVNADRIRTLSYGKDKPVCTESNEECWQRNRHSHFVMQ
jgi:peptidoglycan-associated lipoprotein